MDHGNLLGKRPADRHPTAGRTTISIAPAPGSPTACLLTWEGHDWTADVKHVRATGADLFTAAALSDLLMLMVNQGEAAGRVSALGGDLMVATGRRSYGNPHTVTLMPVGSVKTRQPLVLISRNKLEGVVSTRKARQMGLSWLACAEAAESDQLVAEALRAAGGMTGDRMDGVFAYLRELRSETPRG